MGRTGGGPSGREFQSNQEANPGDKADEHRRSGILMREQVEENVPGILARELKDAVLIEVIQGLTERRGPDGKAFPDIGEMSQIKGEVDKERAGLPCGPGESQFARE